MVVIGADTHKSSHTLAGVEAATGRVLATETVVAKQDGMLSAWRWAHEFGGERVWAIEDCRHVSGRLERCLVGHGERVVRVAPRLMGQSRRGERRPGKSDEIDACAVARVALGEGVDSLPAASLDERALEVRLLGVHRADLVAERTRHQNRLRWHLVELDAELEAFVPARELDRACWLDRIARRLAALEQTVRVGVARDEVRRIRELTRAERTLERELAAEIRALRPDLLTEHGVGPIVAATPIGRTAGAERFPTDGHFAGQAGAAPIPVASGRRDRVRLNPGGDRQLNCALHRIAITRAPKPGPIWPASWPRARPGPRPIAVSSAISPAASGACCTATRLQREQRAAAPELPHHHRLQLDHRVTARRRRRRTQRPTPQATRLRQPQRAARRAAVAITARIRRTSSGRLEQSGGARPRRRVRRTAGDGVARLP